MLKILKILRASKISTTSRKTVRKQIAQYAVVEGAQRLSQTNQCLVALVVYGTFVVKRLFVVINCLKCLGPGRKSLSRSCEGMLIKVNVVSTVEEEVISLRFQSIPRLCTLVVSWSSCALFNLFCIQTVASPSR